MMRIGWRSPDLMQVHIHLILWAFLYSLQAGF